jgi:hypothetical protein
VASPAQPAHNHKGVAIMAIDFNAKDVLHNLAVKFVHAFLPEAKKPYYLKTAHQPELGIHEIASKAEVYNIATPPKIIEEGLSAGIELIFYLVADGYKIKTSLFNLKTRVPGEYDGTETHLAEGAYPQARMQTSAEFRKYLKEHVKVEFDGIDQNEGHIGEVLDEATGLIDEVATKGNLLTIRGSGLKIEADEANKAGEGLYFVEKISKNPIKAAIIAVNEPKTIKVMVPPSLTTGPYFLKIVTRSSAKSSGSLLKQTREVISDFTLTVS